MRGVTSRRSLHVAKPVPTRRSPPLRAATGAAAAASSAARSRDSLAALASAQAALQRHMHACETMLADVPAWPLTAPCCRSRRDGGPRPGASLELMEAVAAGDEAIGATERARLELLGYS